MKLSENWLREWVDPPLDTAALCAQLTMAGLEASHTNCIKEPFTHVVVGEILSKKPHPKQSTLFICEVTIATKLPLMVVTSAHHIKVGDKVALAKVGAKLPALGHLQAKQVQGVISQGMLCTRQDLGLSDEQTLWLLPKTLKVGDDLFKLLQLDDVLIEIDLTPNRGDCLSIQGIAREVAALNEMTLKQEAVPSLEPTYPDTLPVLNKAPLYCPYYVGRLIKGIKPDAAVPLWLQERLRRSEIRSIHPVVDILNYVMLELGQPMHAFDAAKLNTIVIRYAKEGESLTLLDGETVKLNKETVVIADEVRALAIAGVMGGSESAISLATQTVFLESALFTPALIAGKARQYGLRTDASFRFERGVDPALQVVALERATALICLYCGGMPGPPVTWGKQAIPSNITFYIDNATKRLGCPIAPEKGLAILQRLGCQVVVGENRSWQVQPPSFRYDIIEEVDLIEELARLIGYDDIPSLLPHALSKLNVRINSRPSKYPFFAIAFSKVATCRSSIKAAISPGFEKSISVVKKVALKIRLSCLALR